MIMMIAKSLFCHGIRQLAVRQRCLLQAGIHTGLIQRQGIKGCKHTDIGQNRSIVFAVAVTVRRHIHYQRDMEIRSAVHDSLRIFCHAAVKIFRCRIIAAVDRIKIAGTNAASAAQTLLMINVHLMCGLIIYQSIIGTFLHAALTAPAQTLVDLRLALRMLLHFARSGAAAHTDVFNSTAKPRRLMSFEMIQGNKHIRIHDGTTDLRILHIFAAFYRYLDVIRSLESIANDHGTSHRQWRETILPGTVHMLDGILTAAGVQGVAVGQKRHTAQLLYHIRYRFRIIRT